MNTILAVGLSQATGIVVGSVVASTLNTQLLDDNPYLEAEPKDDKKVIFKKRLGKLGVGLAVLGISAATTIVVSGYLEDRWTDDDLNYVDVPQLED